MQIIRSIILWTVGIFCILSGLCILFPCLFILSKNTTFEIARKLFRMIIRIMGIRLEVSGIENIEPRKTYLIMGNHQSLFDVFVIPSAIPLIFVAVEAAYHFSIPIWGFLATWWGNIPIQRRNLESAIKSLEIAKERLRSGKNIAILPEGHRTRTGRVAPFKKGPFHLACGAGADILPFGIEGLYEYQSRGGFLLNPGRVVVRIGKPIPWQQISGMDVESLRQTVFEKVKNLSGE